MVTVELTEEEASLILSNLEWLLSDVRMEMCDTDRADFREGLKLDKHAIQHVIAQLKPTEES